MDETFEVEEISEVEVEDPALSLFMSLCNAWLEANAADVLAEMMEKKKKPLNRANRMTLEVDRYPNKK